MMSEYSNSVPESPQTDALLRVENLQVHHALLGGPLRRRELGVVRSVDGVSFTMRQGEALALVGAPGCGKSTVARAIALLEGSTGGRILFRGTDLAVLRGRRRKHIRRHIQMLFSNPYSAFPPRANVEEIINEALNPGRGPLVRRQDRRAADLMAQVGLNLYLSVRLPRDLSGGNRQRLALARVLAADPTLLICDQPTDYLDRAMGDVFVDLLFELCRRTKLTMLLTTRRLDMARQADRAAIMVLGRIVEMGYIADLVQRPLHPYTQALLEQPSGHLELALDPQRPAPGCRYAPVCPLAEARCHERYPAFVEGAPNHGVACHLVQAV